MKHFGLNKDDVLWGDSWVNFVMYMAPFAEASAEMKNRSGQGGEGYDSAQPLSPLEMYKMFGKNVSKHQG